MVRLAADCFHYTGSALTVFACCEDLDTMVLRSLSYRLTRSYLKREIHLGELHLECVVLWAVWHFKRFSFSRESPWNVSARSHARLSPASDVSGLF